MLYRLVLWMCLVGFLPTLLVASTLTGTVTSVTKKPFSKAIVALSVSTDATPLEVVELGSNGSFTLSTKHLGKYVLTFAAENHVPVVYEGFLLASDQTVPFAVSLGTNVKDKDLDYVKVVTDDMQGDFDKAISMERRSDGTYAVQVPVPDGKLAYQLLIRHTEPGYNTSEQRSCNGTMHSETEYDGGGDFRSLLRSRDSVVTLVFDPSKLPISGLAASVVITDKKAAEIDRLARETENILQTSSALVRSMESDVNKRADLMRNDVAPKAMILANKGVAREVGVIRELYAAQAVAMVGFVGTPTNVDTMQMARLGSILPYTSPVWSLAIQYLHGAMKNVGSERRFDRIVDSIASAGIVSKQDLARTLYGTLLEADFEGRSSVAEAMYAKLMADYAETDEAQMAKKDYAPDRTIRPGNKLPDFSFASLDKPTETITPASLKGKWVLIDLWATWCGPCVAELPTITKAYEEFKSKNFTILSISLDRVPKSIEQFRESRFPMPWLHAFSFGIFSSEAAKVFEVTGIPKPILVSPDGTMVAVSKGLRGEGLLTTLRNTIK